MIKEYINQLINDNEYELDILQKKMKELLEKLDHVQKQCDLLQYNNNVQDNIFSPRNMNHDSKDELEKYHREIAEINVEIDQTRDLIEKYMNKRKEYEELLKENESREKETLYQSSDINNDTFDKKKMKLLLNDVYKKIEIALATMNTNRNRCKMELNDAKKLIKQYAQELE